MYSTGTSTLRRDGLLSRQAVRSDLRRPAAQDLLQVLQRQPGVDDVLDDDDVAALEAAVEVLQQAHLAGRLGALAVARDRDEIQRHAGAHARTRSAMNTNPPFSTQTRWISSLAGIVALDLAAPAR